MSEKWQTYENLLLRLTELEKTESTCFCDEQSLSRSFAICHFIVQLLDASKELVQNASNLRELNDGNELMREDSIAILKQWSLRLEAVASECKESLSRVRSTQIRFLTSSGFR